MTSLDNMVQVSILPEIALRTLFTRLIEHSRRVYLPFSKITFTRDDVKQVSETKVLLYQTELLLSDNQDATQDELYNRLAQLLDIHTEDKLLCLTCAEMAPCQMVKMIETTIRNYS